jgi:hypothetical protein
MSTTTARAFTAVAKNGPEQVWAFFKSEARAKAWCEAKTAEGYNCTVDAEAVK